MIHFPIARFADIARIVPFVRKRGNGIQSEAFKEARRLTQFRAKNGGKRGQAETKTGGKVREGINTLAPTDQPERRFMPGIWDITVSAAFMGMCLPGYHTPRIYLCFGVYTETIAWFIFARCMLVPIPKALHRENTGQK